ncbi:zinc finger protein [Macleaya cordata]|uniref:Zinc finger protein n=1 Tax=Macleaya cordata TaxID=56857 RepID=A0A200Q5U7_MACCD|nr:zinc finger protein [Macleaya cordata]
MGKRKRRTNQKKPLVSTLSSDITPSPCSLGMDYSSEEKSSSFVSSVDAGTVKPLSSVMNTKNGSMKPNIHSSVAQYQNGISGSMLLRHSRHHLSHQHSHQASGSNSDALSLLQKSTPVPLFDERFFSKLANRRYSHSGCQADSSGKAFHKPERLISSSLVMNATSSDVVKIVCGICLKLLKRKTCSEDDTESSSDLSVVAILVCGHVYHADCLEQRTSEMDRSDPPCPICIEFVPLPLEDDAKAKGKNIFAKSVLLSGNCFDGIDDENVKLSFKF